MLRTYFASALRNLRRNRLYAGINIGGLAVGLAAAILIGLFVRDELTYDRFFPQHERIFQLTRTMASLRADAPLVRDSSLLQSMSGEVEAMARLSGDRAIVGRGDVRMREEFYWTDPEFFALFPLPAIAGDPGKALQRPDALVVTREIARKYFGRDDPIGQSIDIGKNTMTIAAVIHDLPSRTHLRATIFASGNAAFSKLMRAKDEPPDQSTTDAYTYLKLRSPESAPAVRALLPEVIKRQGFPETAFTLHLVRLADIHLAPESVDSMKPRGDVATIYAVSAIGILVLLAASVNFVNLMTARATRRALEVGVRKAAGARRSDLVWQFTCESVLYVAMSAVIALALVELLTPAMRAFLERQIVFDYWRDPLLLGSLLALVILVGLIAGAYPAFVLSSFRPVTALKGMRGAGVGGAHFVRQGLVVVQFAILIGLILATTVIHRQTLYALRETVRSATDEILVIRTPCRTGFEEAVRRLPGVRAATCANGLPLRIERSGFTFGMGGKPNGPMLYYATADLDFFDFYGLTARAGRLFSKDHGADVVPGPDGGDAARVAVVVNETAARLMGFNPASKAIGQLSAGSPTNQPADIIGVVEDFHVGPVRNEVPPMIFYVEPKEFTALHVKLIGSRIPETVAEIDRTWKQFGEPRLIVRSFLSNDLQTMYRDLERTAQMLGVFTAVALFIGCLGLFGMSAFNAERRTKEIGVRKALGAETRDITRLLVWQFVKPVLWANLLAWPVGAWAMQRWLEQFASRIDLEPWLFAAASALALGIAVLTVAGHCYLAARARPVSALRYE